MFRLISESILVGLGRSMNFCLSSSWSSALSKVDVETTRKRITRCDECYRTSKILEATKVKDKELEKVYTWDIA